MNYIRLLILLFDLFGALKPLIIITEEFDREQTLEIFSRVYDILSEVFKMSWTKAEFLSSVNKNLKLILYLVDVLYDHFPELFHRLTWQFVNFDRSLWLTVIDGLMVHAQESKEEIQEKITYYSSKYNEQVVEELIKRDLKSQVKKFEVNWEKSVKEAVKTLQDQLSDGKPPDDPDMWDGGWYDHNGWHPKPRKE